ncbi:MAG: response regulator [Deltaproteobacteria bacterium]|nr:response regulator [Deltaproteobacteria bacterium]
MTRPRILLVEDMELNRDLVVQLLEDEYDIVQAEDGLEGVRLAKESKPDLILMDLSLPGIDGWQATFRIKQDPELASIPIVALTAHAMTGDEEHALQAGCDGFLTKPIDENALFAVLRERLAKRKDAAGAGPSCPGKPTVLVVDDNEDNLAQLSEELSEHFAVSLARSGKEALDLCARTLPDVVILDVAMPGMDGLETCQRISAARATADVMVLFCSARADSASVVAALEVGGSDYITRPYSSVELVARVRAAIRMKRAREDLKRQIQGALMPTSSPHDPLHKVWDRRFLFERLEEEARRVRMSHGRPLASILLGVDGDDPMRETLGPQGFDSLIRDLATLVLSHCHDDDLVSRYGDAELLVLLPDVSAARAQELAEELRDRIHVHPFVVGERCVHVTVSLGVAYSDARAASAIGRVVQAADVALYLSRGMGPLRVRVFQA